MFKPVPMKKVRMVGLLGDMQAALSLWRRLGVVQIEHASSHQMGLNPGQPMGIYDQISDQLVKLRAILSALRPTPVPPMAISANALDEAAKIDLNGELSLMADERQALEKSLEPLREQIARYEELSGLDVDFGALPSSLDYHLFKLKAAHAAQLQKKLPKAHTLALAPVPQSDQSVGLLAVQKGTDVSAALSGATMLEMPRIALTPRQYLATLRASLGDARDAQKRLDARLDELSEKHYATVRRLEEALSLDADLALEAGKFANSSSCFFAQGWIQASDFDKLKSTTQKLLAGRVSISEVPASQHHFVGCPTVLSNPGPVAPFEFLVNFLSVPKADEIDPSIFMVLTVPIAYGMIVGDAGYALISMLIAWLLGRASKKGSMLNHFAKIWMIGAIPTFIFGVLFDEYFAFSHHALLGVSLYEPVLHRVENIQGLLLYSILLGWAIIAGGFILGAINAWGHSKKHAIAKLSWLLIQAGGTVAVAAFLLHAMPADAGMIGAAVFGLGAVVMMVTEGPIGLVEIPGLASNIMSYARIAAVGVAGVILAEAINTLILPNPAAMVSVQGVFIFVLTALAYAFAHAANTFIAMFEGFIHSARLSVIEFFSKFFSGGGVLFKPLALRRKFTLDIQSNK